MATDSVFYQKESRLLEDMRRTRPLLLKFMALNASQALTVSVFQSDLTIFPLWKYFTTVQVIVVRISCSKFSDNLFLGAFHWLLPVFYSCGY